MYIYEFIEQYYPIEDKVRAKIENPYKHIEEADDLPFDRIGLDENGQVTKLVEIDDTRTISVLELISLNRDDVLSMNDPDLLSCWDAYMEQVQIEDVDLSDIMRSIQIYNKIKDNRKALLDVLSLQESQG